MSLLVMVRGGGDLASGVVLRLVKTGMKVVVLELPNPVSVRRSVSFSEAVFDKRVLIEGVSGVLASTPDEVKELHSKGAVPVIVDPQGSMILSLHPQVLVDGRMTKKVPETGMDAAPLVIGLGPGFTAGLDCHAVIETQRGHFLGHVIWQGQAEPDTGSPETVLNRQDDRVLRSPGAGVFHTSIKIGEKIQTGQILGEVEGKNLVATFPGILRGMIHDGVVVNAGMKIGDLDPRFDERLTHFVSDKSLAVGGGVLEAILSKKSLREEYLK